MFSRRYSVRPRKPLARLVPIMFALALALMAALPAAATDKTDMVATVRKFVDSFNKGDMQGLTATCSDQVSIIDEFPPYEWHGTGACTKWTDDFGTDAKKNGITDGVVTLGTPRHVEVTADRAYVVVPADYKFKHNGKVVRETSSTLVIALQRTDGTWRMTGWAWGKR